MTNIYDADNQEDEYNDSIEMTDEVKKYMKHLLDQEEWSDIDWLPGDLG